MTATVCKNPAMTSSVVVLAVAPVVGFDAAIPPLVFGQARNPDGDPLYDVSICTVDGAPTTTTMGYGLVPHGDASLLAGADTVVVPGTKVTGPRSDGRLSAELTAALAHVRPGTRLVSICTGAFVLAAAGLLDGRPATTHWRYAEDFRRLFPRVLLDENVLFVDDGDVLSSAGLAAGIDLCLHIVRRDHGAEVANAVARHCVVPPWRDGGQAQYIDRPVPAEDDASTAATRAWAVQHLDRPLDIARLARHARMSERTFNRRFRDETGQSPGVWITAQRVELARHLLETTELPVDTVARKAGLGTGANLRNHLRSSVGVSPLAYRRTFRGRPA
jgi:transcriptional regulator GlxA family with amidase domain